MAEMEVEESVRVTSKYEDLVRHQLSHSSSKEELSHAGAETDVPRADTSDSKRHTPIGDIAAGDGAAEVGDDFSLGSRIMDDILRQHHRSGDPVPDSSSLGAVEDAVSKGGRHTPLSRGLTEAEAERLPGSRPYTPERLQQEPRFRRPSAESDKASQKSRDSQGKGASETESIEDIIRRYSSSSSRQTPTAPEAVEDVLGGEGKPGSTGRRTPQLDRLSWQDRSTPTRDALRDSRHQSPESLPRKSEVKDLVTPPLLGSKTEEVPSRPESVGSADLGASGSLRGQGRPQSLTSEQELSQYFDHRPHSRSSSSTNPRPSPARPRAESDTLHYPSPPGSTPHSISSLPARPGAAQRGRATPDFQVRLPSRQLESKAAAERLTPASLQSSSRTVTPVRETDRASSSSDMESSITNLRKLLFAREAEVEEFKKQIQEQKSINKSLTDQLDRLLRDPANQEHMDLSQQLQQLQSEKEILAAEVVKLRDVLSSSGRVDPQSLSRIGIDVQTPESLQKQIGELQRQMEGYQAASESAASRLARAEARVRELQEENRELRRGSSSDVGLPHRSVATDKETLHYRDQDLEIRREVRQLREDINVLKGLNHAEERGGSSSGFRRERQLDSGYLQDFPRSPAETLDNRSPSPGLLDPRSEVRERRSNYRMDSTEYTSSQHASRAALTRDNLEKHRHSRYTDDFSSSLDQLEIKQSSKDRSFDLAGRDTYHRHSSADDKYESKNARLNAYDPSLVGMRDPPTRTEEGYLRNGRPSYSAHTRETSYHRSKVSGPEELRGSHLDRSLPDGQAEVKSSSFQQSAYSSSSKERSRREVSKEFREERGDLWRQSSDYGFLERNLKPDFRTAAPTAPAAEDAGDVSDTATEILLSIRPEASQLRPSSSFSDDSDDLLSDSENPGASSLHRRSRSLDAKRSGAVPGWGVSSTGSPVFTSSAAASHLRQSTSTERLAPTPPPASAAGFRSVTPKPLTTQHNKAWSTSSSGLLNCSLTQGMRPFAPRSPADMRLGDVVKFSRQGGRLSQGTIKFVGHLPGRSDAYLGVELDKEEGRHDGVFEDIRYFRCKPNKGVFVAFNKIVMAWAPC